MIVRLSNVHYIRNTSVRFSLISVLESMNRSAYPNYARSKLPCSKHFQSRFPLEWSKQLWNRSTKFMLSAEFIPKSYSNRTILNFWPKTFQPYRGRTVFGIWQFLGGDTVIGVIFARYSTFHTRLVDENP